MFEIKLSEPRNVPAANLAALATFSGFLIYQPDERNNQPRERFLQLELESVFYNAKVNQLILKTNCATISLFLFKAGENTDKAHTFVQNVVLSLETPSLGEYECSDVVLEGEIEYHTGKHYSCSLPAKFRCGGLNVNYREVVELNILRLAFEIGGNQQMVANGLYSTPEDFCGSQSNSEL